MTALPPVAWHEPWFAPFRESGLAVEARLAQGLPLPEALAADPASPLRFVAQGELPPKVPYERFIFETGQCPVRENLHDFFNGLCWLKFPQAKRALNRLQAEAIARDGIAGQRGAVRDAITVFDENGAVLLAPPAIWEALLARDWRRLFVTLRGEWNHATFVIFGHALLEGLAAPRKELTAHVWRPAEATATATDIDGWLAAQCLASFLAAKPFTPMPVLGIPGWWAENTNFSFYDDSQVFRPRRAPGPR